MYADAFVDDSVHVKVEVVDLRERLLLDHLLDHGVALGEPESDSKYQE